jgi:hypothetical protein
MTPAGLPQIADALPIDPEDRDVIRHVLAARGREMFQVRNGVAIPTPKSPLICPELSPTVTLWWCRDQPLEAGQDRATAVFSFATPTILDHLQLLARLLLVLRDDGFSQAVKEVRPIATVIAEARRAGQALEAAKSGQGA